METILTRCPSCSKLYNIAGKDIVSESPQFKCQQCESQFWFGFDKKEFASFGANAVTVKSMLIEPFEAQRNKECPKCGAQNLSTSNGGASECAKCGVIIARAQGPSPIHSDEKPLGATAKLHELWEGIMADFEDLQLHEQFINVCRSEGALPYASLKYGKILSVNPNDDIAKIMRTKVITLAGPISVINDQKYILPLRQIIWLSAIAGSLTIIALGLFFRDLNNLAGFGALCFAAIVMMKAYFIRRG